MNTITYCSEEITELPKAMLRVQSELQPALKDRQNPFTKSNYATLNSVMEACRAALLKNGVWLAQYPVPVEAGQLGLVTKCRSRAVQLIQTGGGRAAGAGNQAHPCRKRAVAKLASGHAPAQD